MDSLQALIDTCSLLDRCIHRVSSDDAGFDTKSSEGALFKRDSAALPNGREKIRSKVPIELRAVESGQGRGLDRVGFQPVLKQLARRGQKLRQLPCDGTTSNTSSSALPTRPMPTCFSRALGVSVSHRKNGAEGRNGMNGAGSRLNPVTRAPKPEADGLLTIPGAREESVQNIFAGPLEKLVNAFPCVTRSHSAL